MANCCVKCCRSIKHIPTRVLCIVVLVLQMMTLDYYLVVHKESVWATWAAADTVIIITVTIAFVSSYIYAQRNNLSDDDDNNGKPPFHLIIGLVAWVVYTAILSVKVGFCFYDIAPLLDEDNFFGPNTMKTAVALAGIVYTLLLNTLHDAKPGSERRRYIDELTGTVIFDILDSVDSLEILFEQEARDDFSPGLEIAIIAVTCFNFVLPVIPLTTLTVAKFGHSRMSQNMIMTHKLCLAFLVNLPLLIIRLIVWHGAGHGISTFSLKNVIIICIVTYDVYEHHEIHNNVSASDTTVGRQTESRGDLEEETYELEDRYG